MSYLYLIGTIIFSVYSQLIIKWRVGKYGHFPAGLENKIIFFLKLIIDPFIISGFVVAFFSALCWMATMTKFELSYAYPFVGFTFVLIFIFSAVLFKETVTAYKIIGLLFIVLGIFISSRSV